MPFTKPSCLSGIGRREVLSLHPGQPWKVPAGHRGQQVPGTPGTPCPASLIPLRAQLAPDLCMERSFALAWISALSPFIPLYSFAVVLRAGWMGLMEKGIHHCWGSGVVHVCQCLNGVGTQGNCWWNIPSLVPGLSSAVLSLQQLNHGDPQSSWDRISLSQLN